MYLILSIFADTRLRASWLMITGSYLPFPVSVAAVNFISGIVSDAVKVFSTTVRWFSVAILSLRQHVHAIPEVARILPDTVPGVPAVPPSFTGPVRVIPDVVLTVPGVERAIWDAATAVAKACPLFPAHVKTPGGKAVGRISNN